MHLTLRTGFLLLAFIFFLLDGITVTRAQPQPPRAVQLHWTPLGFAAVVGAFLFPALLP